MSGNHVSSYRTAIFNPYNVPSPQVEPWTGTHALVLPAHCLIWRCTEPAARRDMCEPHAAEIDAEDAPYLEAERKRNAFAAGECPHDDPGCTGVHRTAGASRATVCPTVWTRELARKRAYKIAKRTERLAA